MKLFSKRNKLPRHHSERFQSSYTSQNYLELINPEARNRLISEIKFLTSVNDFLEWFILFENQKENKIILDQQKVDNFSLSELGYEMSEFFDFEDFAIKKQERLVRRPDGESTKKDYFDDYKLFDLAEMIILFAEDQKRDEVIIRLNSILSEEGSDYKIVDFLITKDTGEGIQSIATLLKDSNLRSKINTYYDFEESDDFINAAKISADILNIIFSDYIKNNKKKEVENTITEVVNSLVEKGTDEAAKKKRLIAYIDDLSQISKKLSNDIYDIRHSEKSTIRVSNSYMYKLIANNNINLAELVITTLRDDYILGENWEKIKDEYIDKYNIDRKTRLVIAKPKKPVQPDFDEIDPNDIPF